MAAVLLFWLAAATSGCSVIPLPARVDAPSVSATAAAPESPSSPATDSDTWPWQDSCLLDLGTANSVMAVMSPPVFVRTEQGVPTEEECTYAGAEEFGYYTGELDFMPRFYSDSQVYDTSEAPPGWTAPDAESGYQQACDSYRGAHSTGAQCVDSIGEGLVFYANPRQAWGNLFLSGNHFWYIMVDSDKNQGAERTASQAIKAVAARVAAGQR